MPWPPSGARTPPRLGAEFQDLDTDELASLRAEIALVLQEAFILPISVADNIAYGRHDATDAEIIDAATRANAHEFIDKLPSSR